MKNKFALAAVCAILFVAVLGCSKLNPFSEKSTGSNKTVVEKAIDSTVGDKIGIQECDDVMDELAGLNDAGEDDPYVVRAFRAWYIGKVNESIRQSIEEHKGDKAKIAKECKEIRAQLQKYKAQEKDKK